MTNDKFCIFNLINDHEFFLKNYVDKFYQWPIRAGDN